MGGVDSCLLDSGFGLYEAEKGEEEGKEVDSNAYKFTGARKVTSEHVATFEDVVETSDNTSSN